MSSFGLNGSPRASVRQAAESDVAFIGEANGGLERIQKIVTRE